MKTPALHRFSAEDYHKLAEVGILASDARVELLDGEIHDMSPIGPFHGGITKRLNRLFSSRAKGRWILSVQDAVGLDKYSEPQPDVTLLKPAPDDYTTHHPSPDDVLLLIEVADSSLELDRSRKIPLYARAAIPEVWIINLRELEIEVYREPHLIGYGKKTISRRGEILSPEMFPDVKVDVAELLK